MNMYQKSKLSPMPLKILQSKSLKHWKNDQNRAENEGIFVPTQHPSPWQRHVETINKPEAFDLQDAPLRLGEGLLRLGLGLRLGKPEAFYFFILASPHQSSLFALAKKCLWCRFYFLALFALIFACFTFKTCKTHTDEGLV